MKRLVVACLILGAAIFAACKQGKGDRCQIDDDCVAPLICNKATNTCQGGTQVSEDAMVPDAPTDAPPDTM